jgi:hypothetical protein
MATAFNRYPRKSQLRAELSDEILRGWQPEHPIIGPQTRVIGLGRYFASHFVRWFADRGFNRQQPELPYSTLLRYGAAVESAPILAQQLRSVFGDFNPDDAPWLGADRQKVRATREQQMAFRETLQCADVLILALGVSELWYDRITGDPFRRAIPRHQFTPERHVFRVLTVAETTACLQQIEAIRAEHMPQMKVVFTVSPMRLRATFRPISAVTANSVSKAVMRAALDEFLRGQPDDLGRTLFYFPSYEIITDVFRDPFTEDNSHIQPSAIEHVVDLFARTYTNLMSAVQSRPFPNEDVPRIQSIGQVSELEAKNAELQQICDQRMVVINELDQAAKERLALIEELQQVAEERLAVINQLDAAVRQQVAVASDRRA